MKKTDFDIVVVGCGPGGATAGKFAALNGMRVLVIEQKREIGLPIYDPASVLYSVSETEEYAGMKIQPRWIESMIGESAFISPSGYYGGGQTWPDGISIRRSMFEKALAENATASGARIQTDTRMVDLVKDKNGKITGVRIANGLQVQEITCSVVIGADGIYGNVARLAGIPLPREAVVGCAYEVAGVYPQQKMPTYEIHIGDKIAPGMFAMVAPHSDGKMTFGLIMRPDSLKEDITTRGLAKRFMTHLQEIGRYNFDKSSIVALLASGTTTVLEAPSKSVADNVMLIGDGAWRPLLGTQWGSAGMQTAIITGRWAAEVAAQAIKDGDVSEKSLSRYPEKCVQSTSGRVQEILEARQYYHKIITLPDVKKDKCIKEIGNHVSTLHLFLRGAFKLTGCIKPVKDWFEKEAL
jgi:digeranylgeranylglycerophospholipid reductase